MSVINKGLERPSNVSTYVCALALGVQHDFRVDSVFPVREAKISVSYTFEGAGSDNWYLESNITMPDTNVIASMNRVSNMIDATHVFYNNDFIESRFIYREPTNLQGGWWLKATNQGGTALVSSSILCIVKIELLG